MTDRRRLAGLSLLALGVVYGDIGTSPLYALRECFDGSHRVAVTPANVLGVLSLIFWTLVVVVTLKYVVYVLQFDNRGEGGILALMGVVMADGRRRSAVIVVLGLFGAALLYGDGMVTPAISVLSAIEGLKVATPLFEPYVIPLTIAVLIVLFFFQKRGTGGVGAVFGPVMIVWFTTLALLGIGGIVTAPRVLVAVNPLYAVKFFALNSFGGFMVLGAVFLVSTGGEAMYADLGHFGVKPVRLDWFLIAGPALLLQYFGQGALLLRDPAAAHNPFYLLAPRWALYPLVALSTVATVIASQAIISGVFSLTRQAIQLGYLPRMEIVHTSGAEIGQIYMPAVNRALMVATIVLVIGFGTSSSLAGAYGVAVSTTMVITTLLAFPAARDRGWSVGAAGAVTVAFLCADIMFFGANILKILHGGWVPIAVAYAVFTLMTTWERGRDLLSAYLQEAAISPELFVSSVKSNPPLRVPGTAVFLHRTPDAIPSALLHSMKHYKALHERVLLLTIVTEEISHLDEEGRLAVVPLGEGVFRVTIRYGFMEESDVPAVLAKATGIDGPLLPMETTYFLGRETLILTRRRRGMARWRETLFVSMMRNAESAGKFFRLPPNRVIELGAQIEL